MLNITKSETDAGVGVEKSVMRTKSVGQKGGKKPVRQAAEDAVVVCAYAFLGALVAAGWPVSEAIVYGAIVAGAFAAVAAYGKARVVGLPSSEK